MAEEHEPHNMEEVLEGIEHIAEGHDRVSLGDALDHFGHASFPPLLLLFPLVEISPIGGIPGVPTLIAANIAIVALQMLLGSDHVWFPQFVQNRTVDGKKLALAAHKLDRLAARVDAVLGNRLDFLTRGIWMRVAALLILLLCMTVPPLEVVPFASSLPMVTVALFGLALLVSDGLLMLCGFALTGGTAILLATSLVSSSS